MKILISQNQLKSIIESRILLNEGVKEVKELNRLATDIISYFSEKLYHIINLRFKKDWDEMNIPFFELFDMKLNGYDVLKDFVKTDISFNLWPLNTANGLYYSLTRGGRIDINFPSKDFKNIIATRII